MTTIIVLSIIAVLVLIGATQRKKLATIIKGKTNDLIDGQMNSISVVKQRVRDIKASAVELVNKAAELHALEESQGKQLVELTQQLSREENGAKKAKKDGNKDLAITKLSMIRELKNQINLIEENISTASAQRINLENKIVGIKNKINTYDIKIQGLKARKATNDVLSKMSVSSTNGEVLNDALDTLEEKVSTEEVKLEYKLDLTEEKEDYSEEIESDYENL